MNLHVQDKFMILSTYFIFNEDMKKSKCSVSCKWIIQAKVYLIKHTLLSYSNEHMEYSKLDLSF